MVEGRKLHFLTSGARTNDLVYHPLTDRPFDHRNALAIRPTVRASFPPPLSSAPFQQPLSTPLSFSRWKKKKKIIHRIESLFLNLLAPYSRIQVQMARGMECRFHVRSCSNRTSCLYGYVNIDTMCKVKLILFCNMFNNDY